MIEIRIDEEACVGCGLCADECPTEVLAFDDAEKVAKVVKLGDCIQCLSCYYVCPATAVEYTDAELCPDFYRDVEAIDMAEGII
jgi:L-aspartate semialdehyde sulfurtransferase ferredoxin